MTTPLHNVCAAALLLTAACSGSAQIQLSTSAEAEAEAEAEAPAPEPEAAPAVVEDPPDVHIEGDHLTIDKKIHFGTDSDEIMDDSSELLDHIAQTLKNHTELSVLHVIGHTDSSGDDAHNMDLSKRRAASVVAALKARGVAQKIDSRGAGEEQPACKEDTPECHEKNRRVEFVVEKSE